MTEGGWLATLASYDTALLLIIGAQLRTKLLDALMLYVTEPQNFYLPIAAIAAYRMTLGGGGTRWRHRWLLAGGALLLLGVVDGSATMVKNLVQRARPCHVLVGVELIGSCSDSFSFPSNHAANVFALAAAVAAYDPRFGWLWFAPAALVAYSRVYLGVHYPSDVLCGALAGLAVGRAAGLLAAAPARAPD
ncbi:MAG: phosphatase PAP2 family protein [Deltaproteobacteria bacterium]|nr:phosphatase PAP2 family protein [Deltaproteobacteria bacterium]